MLAKGARGVLAQGAKKKGGTAGRQAPKLQAEASNPKALSQSIEVLKSLVRVSAGEKKGGG